MRRPLFILLLLVSAAQAQTSDDLIIEFHRAGPVRIEADAQTVYASFPRDQRRLIDLELEGHLTPALALSVAGSDMREGLIAELAASSRGLIVWRIHVRDPILKTSKGIAVGSTVGDLREAYEISGVGSGEGRLFVMAEELNVSFELDQSKYGFMQLWRIRDPAEIPPDVTIRSILVVPRPSPNGR